MEEVAAPYHLLVADDCAVVSGQAIRIAGGMTAGLSPGFLLPLLDMA